MFVNFFHLKTDKTKSPEMFFFSKSKRQPDQEVHAYLVLKTSRKYIHKALDYLLIASVVCANVFNTFYI